MRRLQSGISGSMSQVPGDGIFSFEILYEAGLLFSAVQTQRLIKNSLSGVDAGGDVHEG